MISVDQTVVNYSSHYPHKMLGSTLTVGNLSDCEQIVELYVDSTTEHYDFTDIGRKFDEVNQVDLPFSVEPTGNKKLDSIANSERKHEAFYIENPVSKELTKRITLKLGPNA